MLRFKLYALLIFIFFITAIQAKEVDGYVVIGDDTLNVILKLPTNLGSNAIDYIKMQRFVKYESEDGDVFKSMPNEVDRYFFDWGDRVINMVAVNRDPDQLDISFHSFTNKSSKMFLEEVEGGDRVSMYKYRVVKMSMSTTTSSVTTRDGYGRPIGQSGSMVTPQSTLEVKERMVFQKSNGEVLFFNSPIGMKKKAIEVFC